MGKGIADIEQILSEIKGYKYVSFDIFDTLIKRDVPVPSDVFQLIEDQGHPGFKDKRIEAERIARRSKNGREITIDEIYREMEEDCRTLEIDLEKKICVPNIEIKKIYDYCIDNHYSIIITSDIYLYRNTIEEILDGCGYSDYEYLFLSSEYGCMKADGKLFDTVLSHLNISANEIVHIGDNVISDYRVPAKKGIKAILIKGNISHLEYAKYRNILSYDYWAKFTSNRILNDNHFHDRGFEVFGPLLYGFTKWLVEEIEKESVSRVFFLSRDGQIIKKVFDSIYFGNVKSEYLYVSRKALLAPALKTYVNIDDFIENYHFPYSFTAKKLCQMMCCDEKSIIDKIVMETGTENHIFYRDSFINDLQFEKVYMSVKQYMDHYYDAQYNYLRQYLEENHFCGKVAIVDIGWHGNMQKNLELLASEYGLDCEILGYYVAMSPDDDLKNRPNMKGFLFDSSHNQELIKTEQLFNAPFELLFTGNHGTVLGYELSDTIKAKTDKFEIEDSQSIELIRDYQQGAIDFCIDANKETIYKSPNIDYIIDTLFTQFLAPHMHDAKKWGAVTHEDNGSKPIVTYKSQENYLLHPARLVSDYHNSVWKVGFLRQLIPINKSYANMVLTLNKLMNLFRGK